MSKSTEFPETVSIYADNPNTRKKKFERVIQDAYGSGTYLSDYYEAENGIVSLELGNSFPKDVTDCRPGEQRVIKYIAVDDIAEINAERQGDEYILELLPREEVNRGLIDGKKRLRDDLDQAMAKASYKQIASIPAVENQLNPIKQILRWTRIYQPPFEEVRKAQGKDDEKTLRYVNTLEELGFIELRDDGHLYAQRPLDKYDLEEIEGENFTKEILGEVIEQGFKQLSRDLGLGILRNLPKFANGYYLDAVEKEDPGLHLDLDTIHENIIDWYGPSERRHEYVVRDKLDRLTSLGILEKEGEYYTSNTNTYNRMESYSPI
ncbi:hypothetical protein SAMN04488065_2805 [Haloplanus vescus]|uniref:Uncharacterized protein n=1 Tax=Haloplanus vescus TaxID=555874 RepID=A0A1H4AJ26_9EURY|nr:hypothetical protein [Haloplanus vescus]SEA35768.1 hypothetical protein SAMN04488065_2805 [Haloplanus vescus]